MFPFYRIKGIGDVYVPSRFRAIAPDDAPLKLFINEDLGQLSRIFNHFRRGGVAVLSGEWERIAAVMGYIERKKKELIRPSTFPKGKRKAKSSAKRAQLQDRTAAPARVMCWTDEAGLLQVNPPPDLPYLLELVGESPGANKGHPFLIPVLTLQKIQTALAETYPVNALNTSLLASENVLPPRSQETIKLFQRGLRSVKEHLPPETDVVDMGCGSGCLTLLAAQELGSAREIEIYATDLLPEAVATTKLNLQRFANAPGRDEKPHPSPLQINVMPAGDLFQPVSNHCFDLIIFNAPWVVSRARNRSEIAIHDEKQEILRRFFRDAPGYLKSGGRVLLGYADGSGPKAIANLEAIIEAAGVTRVNRFKERVATHRSKRKWEHIIVYELVRDRL